MNKITKQYLEEYVSELGEFETEHRKYSSFWATCTHIITQTDIEELKNGGVDASDFLNVQVTLTGTWSDSDGTDWDSMEFSKVENYEEIVPEKIIPAHVVTKQRHEKFEYNWK